MEGLSSTGLPRLVILEMDVPAYTVKVLAATVPGVF